MDNSEWETYFDLCEKDILEANDYRHSLVPRTLYKFYPLFDNSEVSKERLNNLRQGKLWLSTYKSLNDPIDLSPYYLDVEKLKAGNYSDQTIELFDKFLSQSMRDKIVICSFTTKPWDSMIMWAHYANSHKGFCVEYEVENPHYMWDIYYGKRRFGIANTVINYFYGKMDPKKSSDRYTAVLLQQALVKGKDWEYEQEYRILQWKDDFPEFDEFGGLVDAESMGVKPIKIVAGWQCEYKEQLYEIARELDCQGSTVEPSKTEFKMVEVRNGPSEI